MSRSGNLVHLGQALAVVALLGLAGSSVAAKPKAHGVSRQSFLMITEGMSLKNVQSIIGQDGKEKGEFLNPTYGKVKIWIWGNEKRNIRVHLSKGKVIGKAETGMNKGKN